MYCHETGHSSNDCPSQNSRSINAQRRGMNQQSGNDLWISLIPYQLPVSGRT